MSKGERMTFWTKPKGWCDMHLTNSSHSHPTESNSRGSYSPRTPSGSWLRWTLPVKRFDVIRRIRRSAYSPKSSSRGRRLNTGGGHNDIYAAFVIRTLSWVTLYGMVGAISSNSFLRGKQLEELRCRYIHPYLSAVCDLGLGVMDDAWVESAAYVLQQSPLPSILFIETFAAKGTKQLPFCI